MLYIEVMAVFLLHENVLEMWAEFVSLWGRIIQSLPHRCHTFPPLQCHTEYIHAAAAHLENFWSQKNRISWAQISALMPERGTAASENTKIFWHVSILAVKANYIFLDH